MTDQPDVALALAVINGDTVEALKLANAILARETKAALESARLANERDAETAAREKRVEHNRALKKTHGPALRKRFNAAASHLDHNRSRLARAMPKILRAIGTTWLNSAWGAMLDDLVEHVIGIRWSSGTPQVGHAPRDEDVERVERMLREIKNVRGETNAGGGGA